MDEHANCSLMSKRPKTFARHHCHSVFAHSRRPTGQARECNWRNSCWTMHTIERGIASHAKQRQKKNGPYFVSVYHTHHTYVCTMKTNLTNDDHKQEIMLMRCKQHRTISNIQISECTRLGDISPQGVHVISCDHAICMCHEHFQSNTRLFSRCRIYNLNNS